MRAATALGLGLVLCAELPTVAQAQYELRVGGLFPVFKVDRSLDLAGVQRLHGALMAIEELNDRSDGLYDDLLPDVSLKIALHDTQRDPAQGFRGAMRLAQRPFGNSGVHVYLGAASSGVTKEVALLSTELGIPQMSYSSTAADLSDAQRYPLLMRTPPSDAFLGMAMADLVDHFGWASVATIASDGYYGQSGVRAFMDAAVRLGVDVQLAQTFHEGNSEQMMAVVNRAKDSGQRIIIVFW